MTAVPNQALHLGRHHAVVSSNVTINTEYVVIDSDYVHGSLLLETWFQMQVSPVMQATSITVSTNVASRLHKG